MPVCVSLISPYKENRQNARDVIGSDKFLETFVKCSLNECETRDVKGMYKKARANEIKNFTGVSDDFDIPENPDIIIDSEKNDLDSCVEQIIKNLKEKNFV